MTSTRFWHGFADMHLVKDAEIVFRSGEGVWLESVDGRRFLDATAALWYCAVGYGRREIADAVAEQLRRLPAYSSFGAYTTEPTLALAERLAALAPIDDAVVFLGSGGSDAVDTAAKLARRYWDVQGQPGEADHRVARARLPRDARLGHLPRRHPREQGRLRRRDHRRGRQRRGRTTPRASARCSSRAAHEIAAFIGEPVIGAGGVYPPEPSYWGEVQRLCREHDVLLIADEVITGFGRTGVLWGSQRYGIEPDMIIFAKAVTSGYQPLGGVIVGPRVREPFWDGPAAGPDVRPRLHVLRPRRRLRRRDGQPRHPGAGGARGPGRGPGAPCSIARSGGWARCRSSARSGPSA